MRKTDMLARAPDRAAAKRSRRQARFEPNATLTQDGVARILVERHGRTLRYCHDQRRWFEWTGTYWRQERQKQVFQLSRELAREFTDRSTPGEQKDTRRVAFASGVETFARSDPRCSTEADKWDRDPLLLGTPNGTVDLRTGRLRPPLPEDYITMLTAVAPAETADCPTWQRFVTDATGGDETLIRFLQQWCGYCLTGLTREHALAFIYGPGGNGKSVFVNVLVSIMANYATNAAMETFTASKYDRHSAELAMLRGVRLVTASETERGRPWAEARLKLMTGGDRITARLMRQDFFVYAPAFKLTITGNYAPALSVVDEAVRRRLSIVPFLRTPEQPDLLLAEKLKAEWPGILRWMIDGCLDWQENGLVRPAVVTSATREYFAEQDTFGQWLASECEIAVGRQEWETTADLFASWRAFAETAGEEPGNYKTFAEAMRRNGFENRNSGAARGWSGVKLLGRPSA